MAKKNKSYYYTTGDSKKTVLSPYYLQSFQAKEAYKILRTNLQFFFINKSNRIIIVSSPSSNEGKSTTALNLSVTMADAGSKVLLIDTDLRRPSVHRMLEISSMPGLTNILGGLTSPEEAIRHTKYAGLDVITAGPLPPNPAELLSSTYMEQLLSYVNEKYDYVFIDTSPLAIVTDAMVIEKLTAGIVLVVSEGKTTYDMLAQAKRNLELLDARIIGIVLNEVNYEQKAYSYTKSGGGNYSKYSYYGNFGRSDSE